ncbi:MAG: hypothetical protein R6U17_01675 [Thermoplasmata archaeon]
MKKDAIDENIDAIAALMEVPSIGELTARVLVKEGCTDIKSLEEGGIEEIKKLKMIGDKKCKRIFDEIRGLAESPREVRKELMCPGCSNIVALSYGNCPECGKHFFPMREQFFLPGGILITDPLKILAEYDMKVIEGEDDIWYNRGLILEFLGANEGAEECYDKVVEFNPHHEHIWNTKANLAKKRGHLDEASEDYKLALDFRIGDSGLLCRIYHYEENDDDFEEGGVEFHLHDAMLKMSKFRGKTEKLEHLEQLFSEAIKARNDYQDERAIELAKEIVDKATAP